MESCTDRNGDKWEIYQTTAGWRWRRIAANGKIVGASTEAYSSKANCISNAERNGMTCPPR